MSVKCVLVLGRLHIILLRRVLWLAVLQVVPATLACLTIAGNVVATIETKTNAANVTAEVSKAIKQPKPVM
jgi:hypothetical protein